MKNAMNSVMQAAPGFNKFNLTHDVKLSCNMGWLVPCLVVPCAPGDRWRIGCEMLARLQALLSPVMHRIDMRVEYFFSPDRLVWENQEVWITNGGSDVTQVDPLPARPFINFTGNGDPGVGARWASWPLMDYMGLPNPTQCPNPDEFEKIQVLPFAHYQKIWADYYRDENLQALEGAQPWLLQDGDNLVNAAALLTMRKRAWEADYFTKALPFAQKGEPVDLPLTGFNDVLVFRNETTGQPPFTNIAVDPATPELEVATLLGVGTPVADTLYAQTSELNNMSAATINDLRLAFRLQEWLEKNARGGTRYSELIRAHFNVRPQDARLQRPEYIVGVKNPIQISEVLNTTGTEENPQGTMAGHGISYSQGNYGKYFCQEHGYIIGILSIMPKPAYQQGIEADWLKYTDPTELLWPTFGHLGEQAIQNRELMAFRGDDPITGSQGTFGYKPVYMEYKYMPNRVAGQFRTSLDFWHMGRIFDPSDPPNLNAAFVEADPTTRIYAVEGTPENPIDHVLCQILHKLTVIRALPFYGTPTF